MVQISVDRLYFLPLLFTLAPRVTLRPFLVDCNVLPLTRGKVFPPPLLRGDRSASERFENTRLPTESEPQLPTNSYLLVLLNQKAHPQRVF